MRKCLMCGYLVLGDGEVCTHCGALLPRVLAGALTAGGAVTAPPPAAPLPAAPSLVEAPTVPPGFVSPQPEPFGRSPAAYDTWDPPVPPRPAQRAGATPRVLLAIVSIFSMAFGWIAFDHFFNSDPLPPGTSAFVAGHGVPFTSPDHTFEAQFPATPTIDPEPIRVGVASATLNLAQVQTDDYEVVAASMVLPVSIPSSQVNAAAHEILSSGAASQDAKIVSEKQIVLNGVPGTEVRAKVRDGYDARIVVLISGSRIYMLGAHAKHATSRLFDALAASMVMY